ncbi:hypothetical protein ACJIZ3_022059 [Penstemon smallii]|uniref:Protein kinase domain-containing protein n=1 Tax=Penstemon smallii TaxID=265156 RepID=A0ABD3SNT4_9LAMI
MEKYHKFQPLILLCIFLIYTKSTTGDMRCGSCGKTPVPYPFSTGPNCGDQAYKIRCDQNTNTLYFNSKTDTSYMITSMNPNAQRMVIRPPDVMPNTCFSEDFKTEGFSIDESLPFNITSSNTVLLMNCTDNMLHFNCLCHTYINNTPSAAACKSPPLCCSFRTGGSQNAYVIRVHLNGCMGYQSYVNMDPGLPFSKWPAPGLELMWVAPPEPPCNKNLDCRDLPLSKCSRDPANSGQKRCFCKKGRYWDPATGYCQSDVLNIYKKIHCSTGTLEDGTDIAVKRAKPGNAKGTCQVLNEVRILCQVNHKSLVRLLGCCVELEQPLLIYEYVANGTLFDHLHRPDMGQRTRLTWLRRLFIAHQAADGLAYLHSSAIPPIYHRDVKTSNILLDENLNAKVSDFGLSRLVELSERDYTHINTSAQGTLGYLDPEYYINLQLTDRSDVYSFGVVLLELLTSKKAIDFNRDEESVNLVVYMKRIFDEESLMFVIDPVLRDVASKVELETMKAIGNLAAACLDERRQNRPSMKEVADEIECVISIVTGDVTKT